MHTIKSEEWRLLQLGNMHRWCRLYLRSISVGHSLPDEGSYMAGYIVEMRRRADQLHNLEQGELRPRNCTGPKMPKRPWQNAENDFHPSDRTHENFDTSPSQHLAKEATGDPWT
jgi:hypothetical protein